MYTHKPCIADEEKNGAELKSLFEERRDMSDNQTP